MDQILNSTVLQTLALHLRALTTSLSQSSRLFLTHSQRPPSADTPQTPMTSTLTIWRGALRSSKRRPKPWISQITLRHTQARSVTYTSLSKNWKSSEYLTSTHPLLSPVKWSYIKQTCTFTLNTKAQVTWGGVLYLILLIHRNFFFFFSTAEYLML